MEGHKCMVVPDFQPTRVSEEPVCINLFLQNPVFTSLHLRYPVHVVPPLAITLAFKLKVIKRDLSKKL
jgi:hypothetical protein